MLAIGVHRGFALANRPEPDLRSALPWYPKIPLRHLDIHQNYFSIWSSEDSRGEASTDWQPQYLHDRDRAGYIWSKKTFNQDPVIYTTPMGRGHACLMNKITIWRDPTVSRRADLLGIDIYYDDEVEGQRVHTLGHHGCIDVPDSAPGRKFSNLRGGSWDFQPEIMEFHIAGSDQERIVDVLQRKSNFIPRAHIALGWSWGSPIFLHRR